MSEYHAAVGLASLDRWGEMRQDYMDLALGYSEALSAGNCARLQPGFGQAWLAATCVALLDHDQIDAVTAKLAASNIENTPLVGARSAFTPCDQPLAAWQPRGYRAIVAKHDRLAVPSQSQPGRH